MNIPTLETERLIMRAPGPEDLEAYVVFMASERSHLVGGPLDQNAVWHKLSGICGQWTMRGFGKWALDVKGGPKSVGIVGLYHPEDWPEPEIGWTVFANGEGKGYAFEAAQAARSFAYDTLGWNRIVSLIDPTNTRSLALGARMGLTHENDYAHPKFGTLGVWVHPAPEALQ